MNANMGVWQVGDWCEQVCVKEVSVCVVSAWCVEGASVICVRLVFAATAAVLATGLRHMLEQKQMAAQQASNPPGMQILPPQIQQQQQQPQPAAAEEEEKKTGDDDLPQSLDQQENMKISGSNARHMVMQKLMRQAEVRMCTCRSLQPLTVYHFTVYSP